MYRCTEKDYPGPDSNGDLLLDNPSPPQGLVLPPRVASVQVILVPIRNSKLTAEEDAALNSRADAIVDELGGAGVRARADKRDIYTPGWKYNHWETKVRSLAVPENKCWEAHVF